MILGAEIALIIYGILAMIKGSYTIGKRRNVTGSKARLLGLLCLTPLPLSFCTVATMGTLSLVTSGDTSGNFWMYTAVELIILLTVVIIVFILGREFYSQQMQEVQSLG